MTHFYACLLFTCYQYQGDVFTSFLSSVTITQCPVMKVYPVSLCNILLKSHCSQHSELCSDPACSKYEVKAGARERERTHECRMQIVDVAPEFRYHGWQRDHAKIHQGLLLVESTLNNLLIKMPGASATHAADTGAVYSYL